MLHANSSSNGSEELQLGAPRNNEVSKHDKSTENGGAASEERGFLTSEQAAELRAKVIEFQEARSRSALARCSVIKVDEVLEHLRLLGLAPEEVNFRAIHRNGSARNLKGVGLKWPPMDRGLGQLPGVRTLGESLFQLGQWQEEEGYNLYLLPNAGGTRKDEIAECGSLYCEWDDRPKEWQVEAWRELGLPQPTFQLDTGGKSVHSYWRLEAPAKAERWEALARRLALHCGSDPAVARRGQPMRLAGSAYIGKAGTPHEGKIVGHARILSGSDAERVYPVAMFEELLPELPPEAAKPAKQPGGDVAYSGADSPCPICGRDTDTDCTVFEDGPKVRVVCYRGQSFAPPSLTELVIGQVITGADGARWAYAGESSEGSFGRPAAKFVEDRPLPVVERGAKGFLNPHGVGVEDKDPAVAAAKDALEALRLATCDRGVLEALIDAKFPAEGGPEGAEKVAAGTLVATAIGRYAAASGDEAGKVELMARMKEAAGRGLDVKALGKVVAAGEAAYEREVKALEEDLALAMQPYNEADQKRKEKARRSARVKEAPFRVVGWLGRERIAYLKLPQGHMGTLKPPTGTGSSGLLPLARLAYWEKHFSRGEGLPGVQWEEASSWLIARADRQGVYDPNRRRGLGVWTDEGRVVWHLGDRALVDGKEVGLHEIDSDEYLYDLAPTWTIDEVGKALSDEEGREIVAALQGIGWAEPLAYLLVLGWAVTAGVGGALQVRPALQVTGGSGKGKSTVVREGLLPLLGGPIEMLSNATEAFVRQKAGADCLPCVLDESEQGDGGGYQRAGHLRLARGSYDGDPGGRGSAGHAAIPQRVRFSVALIGINATLSEEADRNRFAVVTRRALPTEEWFVAQERLKKAVTVERGQALLRRTVAGLPVLLANIEAMKRALVRLGARDRQGDTYGTLLAAAHSVTSRTRLSDEEAAAWLAEVGWTEEAADGGDGPAQSEGARCLDHLLQHRTVWRSGEPPATVGELAMTVAMVGKEPGSSGLTAEDLPGAHLQEAKQALARLGVKVEACNNERPEPLLWVATGNNLETIYKGSRWDKGGHAAQLRSLLPDDAGLRESKLQRLTGMPKPAKCLRLPWSVVDPEWERRVARLTGVDVEAIEEVRKRVAAEL